MLKIQEEAAAFIAARVRAGELKVRRGVFVSVRRRPQGLAERIHAAGLRGLRTSWPSADRCAGVARVIHNQR